MSALSVVNVSKAYGARAVLSGVSLEIGLASRIGVVGANGAGKSTLLRILAGEPPDRGRIRRHPRLTVGLLPQELTAREGTSWEAARDAVADVLALRDHWTALGRAITDRPHDAGLLDDYGSAQETLERLGGFHIEATIAEILSGLGLFQATWDRPVASLSGGERTRLNLARTLLQRPDVLLLDEPTNHLDVVAIAWLEAFLARFSGAVVVASHDRAFLDAMVQRVLELDGGTVREYPGNYAAYAAAKARALVARVDAFERHQDEVARLRAFVQARLRRAAGIQGGPKRGRDHYGRVAKKVARGAQAARQRLARLEAEAPATPIVPDRVRLQFAAADRPGAALAHLRAVALRYGDQPVLTDVNLTLGRGDRVGLVGANGSGKSSLLRLLARTLHPSTGEVWVGSGVRAGYLAQEPERTDPGRRVIDVALDAGLTPSEARAVLASLLFRGDRVFQPLHSLSGGERTRLALLELIGCRVNLLLLDEPTNHLDLPSRERFEEALEAYDGTLVIASHDRYLLDRLCTVLWVLQRGTVRVVEGNFSALGASNLTDDRSGTE